MADLAIYQRARIATKTPPTNCQFAGLLAGEAIFAGAACTIRNNSDAVPTVYLASGAAANANADVYGFAATDADSGEAVTLYWDVRFAYAQGMVVPSSYYLSATPGRLADAASTGGTKVIARAVTDSRLEVSRSIFR